jgi:lipopolysaccharide export system protein LptA
MKLVNRIVVALLLVTLASAAAFAKSKTEKISFTSNVNVNGTLVKSGTYTVAFDEQTGALSILQDGKVIAKTATRLEKRERNARGFEFQTRQADMGFELAGVTLGGSDQNVLVGQAGIQTTGN